MTHCNVSLGHQLIQVTQLQHKRVCSFPGGYIGEMRVMQIKLPLNPEPRLVFQLTTTIAIVDRLSLRLDQLKLNVVVEHCEHPPAAVAVVSVLDLSQP